MEDEAERWVGTVFAGNWRIERVLGTGGMGAVLLGRSADGAPVALKVLHPELNAVPEVRKRFLREGLIGSALGGAEPLPGVVRMLGSGETAEGIAYLMMELLQGETLFDRMVRLGTVAPAEVLALAEQVLDVLVVAHARGIVHRDLKPENIHVGNDGLVRMLDFGIARVLDGIHGLPEKTATKTGLIIGTASYMAPEQATGLVSEVDGRADLFGLGATMFRLLSGKTIHGDAQDAMEVIAAATEAAPPLSSIARSVSPNVCSIVDRSLAFLKHHRYPNAETMRADVRAVRAGHQPPYVRAIIEGRLRAGQLPPPEMLGLPGAFPAAAAPAAPAQYAQHAPAHAPSAQHAGQGGMVPAPPSARPQPTLVEPAAPSTTAPDYARANSTLHDGGRRWSLGTLALIVGAASLVTGVIVGIVMVGC